MKQVPKNSDIVIYENEEFLDRIYNIPPEAKKHLQSNIPTKNSRIGYQIRTLEELCGEYPRIPHFKNYLGTAMFLAGKLNDARKILHYCIDQHPDYLMGYVTLAGVDLADGNFARIPKLLGDTMHIDHFCGRNEFHMSEIMSYYRVAVTYFCAIDDYENAMERLSILRNIDQSHPDNLRAEKAMGIFGEDIQRLLTDENVLSELNDLPANKGIINPPDLTHQELFELFDCTYDFSSKKLTEFLNLPRESLIRDLEKILLDSKTRFWYFYENHSDDPDDSSERPVFPAMTLLMLAELESERSLPVILDILSQSDLLLTFWFEELDDFHWRFILERIGRNQLDLLYEMVCSPDYPVYFKAAVTEIVVNTGLLHREKRLRIIRWFKDVLRAYLNDRDSESEFLSYVILSCNVLGAHELLPLIKKCYQKKTIDKDIAGSFAEVKKSIKTVNIQTPETGYVSIFEILDDLTDEYGYGIDEKLLDSPASDIPPPPFFDLDKPTPPIFRTEKKIGRNDPCPCGSGKKYKKCCLKK